MFNELSKAAIVGLVRYVCRGLVGLVAVGKYIRIRADSGALGIGACRSCNLGILFSLVRELSVCVVIVDLFRIALRIVLSRRRLVMIFVIRVNVLSLVVTLGLMLVGINLAWVVNRGWLLV